MMILLLCHCDSHDPEMGLARRLLGCNKTSSARQTTESESVRSETSVVLLMLVHPTDTHSVTKC